MVYMVENVTSKFVKCDIPCSYERSKIIFSQEAAPILNQLARIYTTFSNGAKNFMKGVQKLRIDLCKTCKTHSRHLKSPGYNNLLGQRCQM